MCPTYCAQRTGFESEISLFLVFKAVCWTRYMGQAVGYFLPLDNDNDNNNNDLDNVALTTDNINILHYRSTFK